MKTDEKMHILDLEIKNIKRIKVARIKPEGNVVKIEGENEQGKTSILDSIEYLLKGKKSIPDNPIRNGEQTALIKGIVGKYTVTRKWTNPETSYLKITNEDGFTPPKPQDFLDDLVGDLTFDPLAFTTKDKKDRLNIIRDITGLDLSAEEKIIKDTKEERKLVNRDIDKTKKELENYADLPDLDKELRSASDINAEIESNNNHNDNLDDTEDSLSDAENGKQETIDSISNEDQEIIQLGEKLTSDIDDLKRIHDESVNSCITRREDYKKNIVEYDNKIESFKKFLSGKVQYSNDDLKKELESIEQSSALKFKYQRKEQLEADQKGFVADKDSCQKKIDDAEESKSTKLREVKMPIDGLSLGADDVLYQDNEFGEISQARKIEVSMAIAIAENPKLKICRIKDGSLLDSKSSQKIYDLAEKHDFQVWIERVADKKNKFSDSIYIEDGEIKQ